MKTTPRNYEALTEAAAKLKMVPFVDSTGTVQPGIYCYNGLFAPVDLSASADDAISILCNALYQLSHLADVYHHQSDDEDLVA